jgi:hypothetical protein
VVATFGLDVATAEFSPRSTSRRISYRFVEASHAAAARMPRNRARRPPPHFNKINLCGIILFLTGNDT